MVKLAMEVADMLDTQTDLSVPDFAAVAMAVGIDSYSVTDPELLDEVLTEAFRVDGPVLVEVYTDPNALSMPPKISLSQMAGFSASMVQMLFKDRRKELIETIKSNLKMI